MRTGIKPVWNILIVNCITNSCIWNTCCNLARYWLQDVWGWRDSVETCSSVMICEIIVCICWPGYRITQLRFAFKGLIVNCITNSCIWNTCCNLARYWLQAVWGWYDSVETCSSMIICELIVCICWSLYKTKRKYPLVLTPCLVCTLQIDGVLCEIRSEAEDRVEHGARCDVDFE